jgi:hypothetical protein
VEQECAQGGPALTMAELIRSVVFMPLGYGPRVAASMARYALLAGEGNDVLLAEHRHGERGVPGWPAGDRPDRLP